MEDMRDIVTQHGILIKQLIEQSKENRETNALLRELSVEVGNLAKCLTRATETNDSQAKRLGKLESDTVLIGAGLDSVKKIVWGAAAFIFLAFCGYIFYRITGVSP